MIWLLLLTNAFALEVITWDFEDSEDGFTAEGIQWEWGQIKGDASVDATGEGCWATQASGHYLNDATGHLYFPSVDLRVPERPVMSILHWFDIDPTGEGDHGKVEAFIDGSWRSIDPIYGYAAGTSFSLSSDGWRTDYFDLSSIEATDELRVSFEADESVSRLGWLVDQITIHSGDPVPPMFTNVTPLDDTTEVDALYPVSVEVVDDIAVEQVEIFWRTNGGDIQTDLLTEEDGDWYSTALPNQPPDSIIEWWLLASDGVNTTRWPESGNESFRVFLPAPVDLQAPDALSDGRISATSTLITWTAPEDRYPIVGYDLYVGESSILSTADTEAIVPLRDGLLEVTVQATFDTDAGAYGGDRSEPLLLQVMLPVADNIYPTEGWPGDWVRMNITGENLLLEESDTDIEVGEGITVESIDVVNANHARVMMHIDEDASTGSREITLTRGGTPIEVEPSFSVLSDGIRPQVSDVHPNTIQQGVRATIHIDFSVELPPESELPLVDFGEGIYTESVNRRGDGLDVSISVANDAPLGAHVVEVDTGTRLLRGAQLTVKDDTKQTSTNCSAARIEAGSWCFLLSILVPFYR
ncbi:MAG: hypothetical protein ACPGTU_16220, partial [Myxococcota bacterium]